MKVTHLIQSLDPKDGGPPNVAACHAASLASIGIDVALASLANPNDKQDIDSFLHGFPGMDRVETHPTLRGSVGTAKLKELINETDVVHLHGVWGPVLPTAARMARKANKPYIVTPHGMLNPWPLAQKKLKKQVAMLFRYRKMLLKASALHYLNTDEHNLSGKAIPTESGVVIPNGIFIEQIDTAQASGLFRSSVPGLGDKPFLLYIGRLHHIKGIDYMMQSFEELAKVNNEIAMVLLGPDGGMKKKLASWITHRNYHQRVFLPGAVFGPMKHAALREAACFLLPSRHEGFSIAILEALANRCPVVISNECHFPEIESAGAGYEIELDPKQISNALIDILSDGKRSIQMGANGRDLVASRFTWPRIAEQLRELYQRLIT